MEETTKKSDDHKQLAAVVKSVHTDLRRRYKANNDSLEQIWHDHCRDRKTLQAYSEAMHDLAVEHWDTQHETRISWCRRTLLDYLSGGGLQKILRREAKKIIFERMRSQGQETDSLTIEGTEVDKYVHETYGSKLCEMSCDEKIRLLDVGSCYNPFSDFSEFHTVALDISPAKPSVLLCDFLNLQTTDPLEVASDTLNTYLSSLSNPVEKLPKASFHAVIFSLLLEYFPSQYQRWICCQKAHELLTVNGLLLIITPDSHQQHRNAPMMKSWKTGIESMGFKRCHYLKQDHIHCMSFRKTTETLQDVSILGDVGPECLYIPQDYNDVDIKTASNCCDQFVISPLESSDNVNAFSELPNVPSFMNDDSGISEEDGC